MLITTFFKGRRWKIVNHSRNSQTVPLPCERESLGGPSLAFSATHSFRGCEKKHGPCHRAVQNNHYLPVKSSRVQPQLFSPSLYSLTLWLISKPSPGLSSLLSEPLLSHLLVDLQPFSGNLLSDDIRTIPCRRSSPMIRARLLQFSSGTPITSQML